MLTRKIAQYFRRLPAGRRAFAIIWKAAGWWVALWSALLFFQALVPAGLALLLRTLFNRLGSTPQWSSILQPALGVAGLWIVVLALSNALAWVRAVQAERIQEEVYRLIQIQAMRVDMAFYDHSESYDHLHRVEMETLSQPLAMLENLGSLVQNGLGFLVLAGILFTYAGWLPVLLVATAIPGMLMMVRRILKEHACYLELTIQERRSRYMHRVITDPDGAAELRLFDLGAYHREAFKRIRANLWQHKLRLVWQGALTELAAGLLAWVGSIVGLGWMLHQTIAGHAKLGDLLLCFTAFQAGQGQLRALLECASKIYESLLFIGNLDDFLKVEPAIRSGRPGVSGFPIARSIRFERVSFTYPGGGHLALDAFDLEVPQGKFVALVGHNGAGKSTLIKLLCRFYDPDGGRILFDGVDLRELDLEALRGHITVLFQGPVHYQATVRENIGFGGVNRLSDEKGIWEAARNAGALEPIEGLQGGFETILGRMFGAAELSGGEWQRVALARAFFRDAPLVILDEPTSAMDSWAEQDLLDRFRALVKGKTAILITHRFTTAMHADVIHVIDKGRIIESGSHAQLVVLGGTYAASWAAQMREIGHDQD
jgi:ATP-binding cassette, subfamily B, bacterial